MKNEGFHVRIVGIAAIVFMVVYWTTLLDGDFREVIKDPDPEPVTNATEKYANGVERRVYEMYPYQRLNDLPVRYKTMKGDNVYIEKIVDLTTGVVYFLTTDASGNSVSIQPVYDHNGKVMVVSPTPKEDEE